MQRLTSMERAFHLARSGRFTTLTEVVTTLDREGYSANQIQGPLLKRQLTGLIKAARPEPLDREPLARRPGQSSNGRPVRGWRATKGRETIEPHRHVGAHTGPHRGARKRICEAIGGWLAQGPRGRGSQVLLPTENGASPRRRCWATRRAHLPLCRSALQAPRPSPSARGLLQRRLGRSRTVPAALSGVAEGSGAGWNSELGFCAMPGKSGGRVRGLTGGGSGGSQTRVPANGEIHPSQYLRAPARS